MLEHGIPVLLALGPGVAIGIALAVLLQSSLGLDAFIGDGSRSRSPSTGWRSRSWRRCSLSSSSWPSASAPGCRAGRRLSRRCGWVRHERDGGPAARRRRAGPARPPGRLGRGRRRDGRARSAGRRAPSGGPVILCDGVVKIYKVADLEVVALQGLDLTVDPGEFIAIVGASGSGKSTLLSILGGLDVPSAGRVVVDGHLVGEMDAAERTRYRRQVLGFVWQQTARNLLPYLTACENVELPMLLEGVPRGDRTARAAWLLELVGLADRAGHRPGPAVGRRAAARRDRGRAGQRAGGAARRRAHGRARHGDRPRGLRAAARRQPPAGGHDRRRHPRPARQRAGEPHGRDPRRADEHRDAAPAGAQRGGRPPRDRRGVRRARPGRPAAAAASARRGTGAAAAGAPRARGRPHRDLARRHRLRERARAG